MGVISGLHQLLALLPLGHAALLSFCHSQRFCCPCWSAQALTMVASAALLPSAVPADQIQLMTMGGHSGLVWVSTGMYCIKYTSAAAASWPICCNGEASQAHIGEATASILSEEPTDAVLQQCSFETAVSITQWALVTVLTTCFSVMCFNSLSNDEQ